MVAAGLYERSSFAVPVPDVVLGAHLTPGPAGRIGTRRGLVATSADSLRVTVRGRSAHASMPHAATDPVLMAAHCIVKLQSLVSRETDPADAAVVTVACVRAGEAENIIPDDARFSVDVRAVRPETRDRTLRRLQEVVRCECRGAGAELEPLFVHTREFPATVNDVATTERVEAGFREYFGGGVGGGVGVGVGSVSGGTYDDDIPRFSASEDFSILATAVDRPYCFWMWAGTDPDVWDRASREGRMKEDVPINHSALFAPVIQPTLKVGIEGYAVAALSFLGRPTAG
jgi:amidohydrolase